MAFNKVVLYIGIVAIILGQSIGNDWQFYTGLYLFSSCTFYYLSTFVSGIERQIMMFLCGVSFYNVVKQPFEDVTKDSIFEYLSFFFGIFFILLSYAKRNNH